MEYNVKFGTWYDIDRLGFVGKGKLSIDEKTGHVHLTGRIRWPILAQLGIFLAITLGFFFITGLPIGWLIALLLMDRLCASPGTIVLEKTIITNIKRSKRRISFMAPVEYGGRYRKCLFSAMTEEEAQAIEAQLSL